MTGHDPKDIKARIRAKIPGTDTNIEIRHTVCDICCPSFHCGLDAYVQNGRIIRIEGMETHPVSRGHICTKGQMHRQYLYRPDRILTPLRRTGRRGEGRFEPITWEEAYREIALRLNAIRKESGPEAVMMVSGYSKWYRPFLHRLAYSFGTPNYATESSNCMYATFLHWLTVTGHTMCYSDVSHSGVFLGWAFHPYYSRDMAAEIVEKRKAEGMKVILVDPRVTPAARRLADIHLRLRPGTDGALALGLAHILIREGMTDEEYIRRYVYGYEEYRRYADSFTPQRTEAETGVPAALIEEAARMIGRHLPLSICESASPVTHHENGFQNYRAVMALSAITGSFDRPGGQIPLSFDYNYQASGLDIDEPGFIHEHRPKSMAEPLGKRRFPLWSRLIDEAQSNDLLRQLKSKKPYPIRAILGFGYNYRIGPADQRLRRELLNTDFLVNTDLFLTDTCKLCDIILPACTSFERGELKIWPDGYIWYTKPVISPLGQARSDVEIICQLADALDVPDPLLRAGPDACYQRLIEKLPITLTELQNAPAPRKLPVRKYIPGSCLAQGLPTKSGRFELCSLTMEELSDPRLAPLPRYQRPQTEDARQNGMLCLCSAPRRPGLLHSRLMNLPWSLLLHEEGTVEIHPDDAVRLGIAEGDPVNLSTKEGTICGKATLSEEGMPGFLYLYHDIPQTDFNRLIGEEQLDPCSGFPAFRGIPVQVRKAGAAPCQKPVGEAKTSGAVPAAIWAAQWNSRLCTGCGACVVACMDQNDIRPQQGEPPLCRIRKDKKTGGWLRTACLHCEAPVCMTVCPAKAIRKDADTGLVVLSASRCLGCGSCQKACPRGAIFRDSQNRFTKCDGCLERIREGLLPACVKACARKALSVPCRAKAGSATGI